jgi:hypothetical protein
MDLNQINNFPKVYLHANNQLFEDEFATAENGEIANRRADFRPQPHIGDPDPNRCQTLIPFDKQTHSYV